MPDDKPPTTENQEQLRLASAQFLDLFSMFGDVAIGARKELVDGGFSEGMAEGIVAEFIREAMRHAFDSLRPSKPSLTDLLRGKRE
jgi:hypothetical protein